MFVEINNDYQNKYCIQSYYTKDVTEDGVTSYLIIYHLVSGVVLIESFDTDSERDVKLNQLEGD